MKKQIVSRLAFIRHIVSNGISVEKCYFAQDIAANGLKLGNITIPLLRNIKGINIYDSDFKNCIMRNIMLFSRIGIFNSNFYNCKIWDIKTDFRIHINECKFYNCNIGITLDFAYVRFSDCEFVNCTFTIGDNHQSTDSVANFYNCKFDNCTFTPASDSFVRISLAECRLDETTLNSTIRCKATKKEGATPQGSK